MDLITLLLVFIAGLVAGFIGTTVGGGGLISIPVLIFLGLPPQMAIATSHFGYLGIITAGFYKFHKAGKVDYKLGIPIAVLSIIGSVVGAFTLLSIPNDILEKLVAVFILLILIIILINKNIGVKKAKPTIGFLKYFGYLLFLLLGFWGAFFGGGFSIFATYILIFLFGKTFLESAGTRKILAFGIVLTAIIIFSLNGAIDWIFGTSLIIGMALGSFYGASHGIKKGDEWVRGLFIIIVLASAIKLLIYT